MKTKKKVIKLVIIWLLIAVVLTSCSYNLFMGIRSFGVGSYYVDFKEHKKPLREFVDMVLEWYDEYSDQYEYDYIRLCTLGEGKARLKFCKSEEIDSPYVDLELDEKQSNLMHAAYYAFGEDSGDTDWTAHLREVRVSAGEVDFKTDKPYGLLYRVNGLKPKKSEKQVDFYHRVSLRWFHYAE